VLPLVRMIRDGYDAGCEAGCALAARVAVSRGAAAGEASLDAHKEVTVYGASGVPAPAGGAGEDTTGATLDDMRKRRQANDFVNLEEECEVSGWMTAAAPRRPRLFPARRRSDGLSAEDCS